ncbi:MAG: hypothetical protein AAGF11_40230 [Myxococcota bacterium]
MSTDIGGTTTFFQIGGTTTVQHNYGLRWDINPAIVGLNRLLPTVRSTGRLDKYLRLGPGNIIMVPAAPVRAVMAVINTFVNFEILVGQDANGIWAGYLRIAIGVGQELGGIFGFLDTVEDYMSGLNPALNFVPTPIVWGDQTVPDRAFGVYASGSSWAGVSHAFSGAPTSGNVTFGALLEGSAIFRLPTVEQ